MASVLNKAYDWMTETALYEGCPIDQIANYIKAGLVPNPKQWRFCAAARMADKKDGPREIQFGGARGPGKSWITLAQMGVDDCQRYEGLKFLSLRKVGKSNKESMEDLIPRVFSQTPHKWVASRGTLFFPNGSRIVCGHFQNESDIDKYLGLEFDGINVEEATTLSLTKYRNITTCLRTSKPGWRPRMYGSTNPGGIGHGWYKNRFIVPWKKGKQKETRFIKATWRDNPNLDDDYYKILDSLVGWQRKAWLNGDFDVSAGQYFTNWNENIHVYDVNEWRPQVNDDWDVWCSFDYGFTHYTVIYLIVQNREGMVYFLDELSAMKTLPETIAQEFFSMLARNGISPGRINKIAAGHDAFNRDRDGKTIAEDYERHGMILERAKIDRIAGAGVMLTYLGDSARGLPPRMMVSSRCQGLISCLPSMIHSDTNPEDVKKVHSSEDGEGGDDFYDSARYGLMEAERIDTVSRSESPMPTR